MLWPAGSQSSTTERLSQSPMSLPPSNTRFWLKTLVLPAVALFVGTYLLSWNESRAVSKSRTLSQVAAGLVTIPSDSVHSVNDGKFVHLTGQLQTSDTLKDPDFGVSGQLIKLQRDVEMYQWTQLVVERKLPTPDGGTEVRKDFAYARNWSTGVIDSNGFKEKDQYPNPNPEKLPYPVWSGEASDVRVGAFRLNDSLVKIYNEFVPQAVVESDLANVSEELRNKFRVREGKFYNSKDPANPQIGDIRISFRKAPGGTVSVLGKQEGETLGPYPTPLGQQFEALATGKKSASSMFYQQAPAPANTPWFWIVRGVGFAVLACGCWIWIPYLMPLGSRIRLLRLALGGSWRVNAIIAAGMLWLIVVGTEWLDDRPIVAVGSWVLAAALPVSCALTRMNRGAAKT